MIFGWLRHDPEPRSAPARMPDAEAPRYDFDDERARTLLLDIRNEFGLDYEKQEFVTLRKIERFCRLHGLVSFEALEEALKSDAALKERLINRLTVGETYFYREPEQFEAIAAIARGVPSLSILSAPCSSGEEVYSILMHLEERGVTESVEILGIDINSEALETARRGCYRTRSVTRLPAKLLAKRFETDAEGRRHCLKENFKNRARFVRMNVFDEGFGRLGRFDVVVSRNMLIYFRNEEKRRALERFRSALRPGGYLFLGHADVDFVPDGFEKIRLEGALCYRRR